MTLDRDGLLARYDGQVARYNQIDAAEAQAVEAGDYESARWLARRRRWLEFSFLRTAERLNQLSTGDAQ